MEIPADQTPFCFGGVLPPHSDYDTSRFVVIPVPYEGTVSYLKGTARGPKAVIDASRNMELYDEVLRAEPYLAGIHTMEALEVPAAPEDVIARLAEVVDDVLADQKTPVTLGGEHSITLGPVRAAKERFDELCVLQLDAHADLRDEYEDTPYSHASVMRRCLEVAPVTQVGVRSLSKGEADLLRRESNVTTYFAHDLPGGGLASMQPEILSTLTDEVYLSVDVDVFDPAFVPGTGTPEPGGLNWEEVTSFLRALTLEKQVVGFDVVEVFPLEGNVISEFLAARLTYRLIGCIAESAGWLKAQGPA